MPSAIKRGIGDSVRDWVDGLTVLGARGGALEEVGVGKWIEVGTTTIAAAAQWIQRCPRRGPYAVVSVGEGCGRPSR